MYGEYKMNINTIKQITLAATIILGLTACNSGGNSNNTNNNPPTQAPTLTTAPVDKAQNISGGLKDPQTSGYTMIVGAPYNTAGDQPARQFYSDLLARIKNQSKLKINRIMLNIDNPTQHGRK